MHYANSIIDKEHTFVRFINTTEDTVLIPNNFKPQIIPLKCFDIHTNNQNKPSERQQEVLHNLRLHHCDPKLKNELEHSCCHLATFLSLKMIS